MIVTDLDGTLLRTDKTISDYTNAVLGRCRRAGIKVAYATGRGGSAEQVAPSGFFDGRISMNGAIAKASDRIVYNRPIPYLAVRLLLSACDERGIRIVSENSDIHYSNFVVSDVWEHISNYVIVDFLRHNVDAEKIYTPSPTPDDILFIKRMLPDSLYFVLTADGNRSLGQVMHKDATKAKAAAALAHSWDIDKSDIVAFGDDYNDVDMIKECGIGVVVANAVDECKIVADFICGDCDNDGVAKWLDENIVWNTELRSEVECRIWN